MRSPDFDLASEDREGNRGMWSSAASVVDSVAKRLEITEALRPLLRTLVSGQRSEILVDETTIPADDELRIALTAVLLRRNCDASSNTQAAAWLFAADAVAENFAAEPPSRDAFEAVHDNSRFPWEFTARIERRLVDLLRNSDARKAEWINWLESASPDLVDELAADIGPAVRTRAEQWQRQTDPFAVFEPEYLRGGLGWSRAVEWTLTRCRVLLALAPARFLVALDNFPVPHLMWSTVQLLRLHEDPDLVLSLIRVAPSVWQQDGQWTRSVALFIVADLIDDYVRAVRDAVKGAAESPFMTQNPDVVARKQRASERLRELETSELMRWATQAASAVLERPDGLAVMLNQAARHARVLTLGDWAYKRGDWSPTRTTLNALASALAAIKVSARSFRDFWSARERVRSQKSHQTAPTSEGAAVIATEGLPHLVAAIHVLQYRIKQKREAPDDEQSRESEALWVWLSELFLGRDPGIDLIRINRSDFALQYVGHLVAAQTSPSDKWKAVYCALEGQRRRCWTRDRGDDFLPPRTSADFIWVGFFGCASWRDAADQPMPGAREFLFEIVECAKSLFLLDAGIDLTGRAATEAFTTCFAVAHRVFGLTTVEDVVTLLEPFANDPPVLRDVFKMLRQNGVEDPEMAAICTALDVDEQETVAFANRVDPPPPSQP